MGTTPVRDVHGIISKLLKLLLTKKTSTFVTVVPLTRMLFIVVKMADAVVFMLKLTITSPAIRQIRRITANQLPTARRHHQGRRIITIKMTMLSWNGFCIHSIRGDGCLLSRLLRFCRHIPFHSSSLSLRLMVARITPYCNKPPALPVRCEKTLPFPGIWG